MQELEKILEDIRGLEKILITDPIKLMVDMGEVEDIIRKHMNAGERFEFDFTNVKSFDCQCGRHYVNTGAENNDGWIPVEERLPEEPKENPVFDDKPLELYLVDMGGSYPLRAFWNGKQFTDGWSILKVIAWRPLPEPYRPERSEK